MGSHSLQVVYIHTLTLPPSLPPSLTPSLPPSLPTSFSHNPIFRQVTLNMGLCYEHLNELDKAEKYFKKSANAVPTNPDVFNTLGSLYVRTGQIDNTSKQTYT